MLRPTQASIESCHQGSELVLCRLFPAQLLAPQSAQDMGKSSKRQRRDAQGHTLRVKAVQGQASALDLLRRAEGAAAGCQRVRC